MCQNSGLDITAEFVTMFSSTIPIRDDKFKVNGLTKHTKSFLDNCVKQDSGNVVSKTGVLLFLGGNEILFPNLLTLQSFSLSKNET